MIVRFCEIQSAPSWHGLSRNERSPCYSQVVPKVSDAHLAARREQIIEAAMARFAEGGFHSTGMVEVITATGLSAGAVYRYFPSKEALIRAIVEERVLTAAAAAFERILDEGVDDPVEAVSAALGTVDAISAREGVDLTRVAVQAWAEALRNPDILEVAQGAYARMRFYLAAVARRGQEHGRLAADADPDELAKTMLSLAMGYLIQRLIMNDVDRDSYVAALRALTSLTPAADRA
jgi:AcrR family transcriptional regulator